MHPSCVIYRGKCSCGEEYIGETEKNVEKRWSEHINRGVHLGHQPLSHPPQKHHSPLFHQSPLLNLRTTFFYCFLSKNFNPPWKMSPALCSNPLLKFGTLSSPPTFQKFGSRLNPSVVADELSEIDHFAKLALKGVVLLLLNQGNCWNFTPLQ